MDAPKDEDRHSKEQKPSNLTDHQFAVAMFALGEAGRTLIHQQAELDRLRERAVAQLGLAFALSTFIIGSILDSSPPKGTLFYSSMVVSTLTAAVSIGLSYDVWRIVHSWTMKVNPVGIVQYATPDPELNDLIELIEHYETARATNEPLLVRKRAAFQMATGATAGLLLLLVSAMWALG